MTDRRRELKRRYLAAERARERALLPLTDAELHGLLAALDEWLDREGCDHTLAATERWLRENGKGEEVVEGLQELGGYCDCEVLLDVDADRFRADERSAGGLPPADRSWSPVSDRTGIRRNC